MMNLKLMPIFLSGLALGLYTGCGGGGGSSSGVSSNSSNLPRTTYKVKVVDDAVAGANIEAAGCVNSKSLGGGNYSIECAIPPKYIMAKGGYIDLNQNGKHDDDETSMGLPLLLNLDKTLFDVDMSNITITPLSTLVANIKSKKELKDLASKLGISSKDFNKDISTKKKELFQTLNSLLIVADNSGITDQSLLMKKLRKYITGSNKKNLNDILEDSLDKLKNDDELKKAYGSVFISGFIDESKSFIGKSNILEELAKEYADNDKSQVFITGFIYDGIIENATIKIFDGKKKVGEAKSSNNGRWKISIQKKILKSDKVLIFTGTATDSNGDKILLKSAITTKYLRELSKNRISVSDSIDLFISNVTTAQVAILEKNDKSFATKPNKLESNKNQIELFQQDVLLKASAAIKAIIDGDARIDKNTDTYNFIVDNLVIVNQKKYTVNLDIEDKISEEELDKQSKAIEEDAILSKQLLNIESEKSLSPLLNKPLYSIEYYFNNNSFTKYYTKTVIHKDEIEYTTYILKGNKWKKENTYKHKGKLIDNVFYVDQVKKDKTVVAPCAITLKEIKTVHSIKLNKDYTFNVMGSQLYRPFDGRDTNKVSLSIKTDSFDMVSLFKSLEDSKVQNNLPADYSTLSLEEQNRVLTSYIIKKIGETPEPFDRDKTKLTPALDIAKNIDFENDNIVEKLNSIKTILNSAKADDKDAQVGKAIFSLAEITNSPMVGNLIKIKLDGSSVLTNENLATILKTSNNDKELEVELLSSISNLSEMSMDVVHEVVLKLQDINTTLGENFANERYVFSYDDINITSNQSKLIRVAILAAASKLEYLTAFDYVTLDDVKTRTTTINGVIAEYTNVESNPLSVFSRPEVGSVNSAIGATRLAYSKALLLEAIDTLETVVASKEEPEDAEDIREAQIELPTLKASLNGTGLYEVEGEDGAKTIKYYLDLSALYNTSTALDLTHTLGHNGLYDEGWNYYLYNGDSYRPGNYDLALSQLYNTPMSNEWINESDGSTVNYDAFNGVLPDLEFEPQNIPTGSNSHILNVLKKVKIIEPGKRTITHTGDNILKYIFNDLDYDIEYNDADNTMTYHIQEHDISIPDSNVRYGVDILYGNVEFSSTDSVNGVFTIKVKDGFTGSQCFDLDIYDTLGHSELSYACLYKE